jgi:hypothetical protein
LSAEPDAIFLFRKPPFFLSGFFSKNKKMDPKKKDGPQKKTESLTSLKIFCLPNLWRKKGCEVLC